MRLARNWFYGRRAHCFIASAKGGIWRVRMTWSNGRENYFGKFTSERDAIAWINAHPRLTKPRCRKHGARCGSVVLIRRGSLMMNSATHLIGFLLGPPNVSP